jgi:dihydroorotate dehydrogenase electron transfer subunit
VIQTQATIVQKETIGPAWWRLLINVPALTPPLLPGQFLLLRCADPFTCYLRRAIFPTPVDDEHISLLIRPDPDPGLAWLSARQPGDQIDLIGPLGTGFALSDQARHLLLVSDSQNIDSLLGQMEQAIAAGMSVTLALGGSRASILYPVSALPPVVEFHVATLDGSTGHRGPVTDLLPALIPWADAMCAIGSVKFYRALKSLIEQVRFKMGTGFASGLVTTQPLACGVGACLSCAVETNHGLKLACLDGPVFDLAALNM